MKNRLLSLVLAAAALVPVSTPAASVTWDGSASGYWSNGGNWVGGIAPAPGDSLIFPVSVTRYITTNNFASGTAFGGIAVHGSNYVFRGNRLVLEDDLRALAQSGPVTFDLAITVDGPLLVTQFEARYASVPTFNGAIQLVNPAHSLQFVNGQINVGGAITGASGVQVTSCDLFLFGSGVNTYTGGTKLSSASTLHLNKTVADAALPPNGLVERLGGSLNSLRWLRDEQVADNAFLENLYLDLNGQTETLDDFDTSNLLTNGTLSINRHIVGSGAYLSGNGNGRIHLNPGNHQILSDGNTISTVRYELTGPGNLVKMGTGRMYLENSNSFTGSLIVSNGMVDLRNDHALGSTNVGVFVRAGATLNLRNNVRIQGEPLSLDGTGYFDPEFTWLPHGFGALHSVSLSNAWNGPITLNGNVSICSQEEGLGPDLTNTFLHLGGVISGYGPLYKEGQGAVIFTGTGANTYTESTVVREGTLKLDKTGAIAIPGLLSIGAAGVVSTARVDVVRGAQIADNTDVTIYPGGRLHMNNQSDTIRNLQLVDGTLYTDTGALVVTGNLTAIDAPELPYANTIYGGTSGSGRLLFSPAAHDITLIEDVGGDFVLNVGAEIGGSGALRLLGDGFLHLASSNSFTGLLTVSSRGLAITANHALGGTGNGTIVSSNATLALYGVGVTGESLTLRGGASLYAAFDQPAWWNGPIALPDTNTHVAVWGTSMQEIGKFTLNGVISGPGDLRITGGQVMLAGSQDNTQSGDVIVLDSTLLLSKTNAAAIASRLYIGYWDSPGAATARHLRPNQIADDASVYLSDTCVWDLGGFSETVGQLGGVSGSEVHMGAGTLTVDKSVGYYGFWGVLSGTGGFIKRGSGSTHIAGNNTYTGPTLIEGGELGIWGEQPQSHVTVSPGATLSGNGTLGHVNAASGATVAAGFLFWEPVMTTSNLTLQAGSTLELILYGPGSNQLVRTRGSVALNAAALSLNWNYPPQPGDTFKLIDNDGADLVNGTFAGFPAGQFTGPNGLLLEMIYGNDVTLRVLSPGQTNLPPGIGLTVTGGNGNGAIDPNECNQLRVAIFNNSTNELPPFQTMLLSDMPEVLVTQPASAYPAIPAQTSAQNVTPFQISSTANLACGTNIPCRLLILTTNGSAYAIDLALPTGSPAAPVTYTAAPNAPVLDGILTESSIPVALLAGHLARVEVSVFIEHALSSDLTIKLVAPDGTEVLLAEDLGNGMNYGTGCANAARTTFTDDAPAAIGSAGAPFVGTFRPAGWLSTLRGMPGAAVAGNWKLRVNDHVHFNTGVLRCWSLTLAPATCTDGGGRCDPCPGPITAAVGPAPLANGHITIYNGPASNCFSNKQPGSVVAGSFPYRAHAFTNLSSQPTCVSVRFTPRCQVDSLSLLTAAAYLGAFDPANVSANFLGDDALTLGAGVPRTFAFQVPASNTFEIVVTVIGNPGCTDYLLEVLSPDLCPVSLNIAALNANTMRLDWPTHAAGYELQRSPAVFPANWSDVVTPPVVTSDRFVVTNAVVDPNGFYRLRKP